MPIPGSDHPITLEPATRRWRVYSQGHVIADSDEALILRETGLPPVVYFPREAVAMEYMGLTPRVTSCPYKGEAHYYTLTLDGEILENVAWTYEHRRGVFWLFAVQATVFSAAAMPLLRGSQSRRDGPGVPWLQLGVLTLAVGAIAVADLAAQPALSLALIAAGLAVLVVVVRIDARARVRLLPREAASLSTVAGAGYAAMFLLTAASMGFAIYGPPILQVLRGYSPLWAGYVVGVESLAWTAAAFLVADASARWDAIWVRTGAVCLILSMVVLSCALADRPIVWTLAGASLLGAAFGLSWSFMSRRVMAVLSDEDRAIGSSAIMAVRQTGAAAGSALAGAAANLAGFAHGATPEAARAASVSVFLIAIPLALAGTWAAFRMTEAR